MSEEVQEAQEDAAAEVTENIETNDMEVTEESESVETTGEDETPKPPKKNRVQDRINELTRAKYEQEREKELARAEAEELRQKVQRFEQQAFNQNLQSGAPTIDQFDYDQNAFQQAYSNWYNGKLQERAQQLNQERAKRSQAERQAKQQTEVKMKLAEGGERYPDFQQVISNPALPSIPANNPTAYEEIIASDKTADILYYLAKNPEEAQRIIGLNNPHQTRRELYKLEASLDRKPEKTETAAPKPVEKIQSSPASIRKDPEKMSTEEWMKWRQKQLSK